MDDIKQLINQLSETSSISGLPHEVACSAARTLANLGPRGKLALPALANALGQNTYILRRRAAEAIFAIGPSEEDIMPQLVKAFLEESSGFYWDDPYFLYNQDDFVLFLWNIIQKFDPSLNRFYSTLNELDLMYRSIAESALEGLEQNGLLIKEQI